MKVIYMLGMMLFSVHAHAEAYKCARNGKTSYQDRPCPNEGREFKYGADISYPQQQRAQSRLMEALKVRDEQQRVVKEAVDKERVIQAQELRARSAARAVKEVPKNDFQNSRDSNNTQYIYSPPRRRPGAIKPNRPKPVHPIVR